MKKFLIALVAVLGFASLSHAQGFTIRLGPTVVFSGGAVIGVDAELNARNLTRFSTDLSLGAYASAALFFGGGSVVGNVSAGPTVNFGFSGGQGNAFVGFVLGLGFASVGGGFDLGFISGVDYLVTPGINLFARLGTNFLNGFGGSFALGADYAFSSSLAAYLKLGANFGGGFGLGGGVKFAL